MPQERFEDLTTQELFDKMISHHMRSVDKQRTKKSRWHHQNSYEHTKRLLWERSDDNADHKSD